MKFLLFICLLSCIAALLPDTGFSAERSSPGRKNPPRSKKKNAQYRKNAIVKKTTDIPIYHGENVVEYLSQPPKHPLSSPKVTLRTEVPCNTLYGLHEAKTNTASNYPVILQKDRFFLHNIQSKENASLPNSDNTPRNAPISLHHLEPTSKDSTKLDSLTAAESIEALRRELAPVFDTELADPSSYFEIPMVVKTHLHNFFINFGNFALNFPASYP
jgi:hypothetical protein